MDEVRILFSDKTILITGGTGTLGSYFAEQLLRTNCKRIIIFSRDENKQFLMQQQYKDKRVEYVIGDIRNLQRIESALCDVDYVIHAAAMKHVPIAEMHPMEAVETNIIGTQNVLLGCIHKKVKTVVCLSTDKAISPTNCMGMTKGISERVMRSFACSSDSTNIICVRLGNVLGSRGSVIPLWRVQIAKHGKITLTDKKMTRFIMTYNEVFQLVEHAFANGCNGEIVVPHLAACNINDMARVVCMHYGLDADKDILVTGLRPGEKLYEELFTVEELTCIYQNDKYYHIGSASSDVVFSAIPYRSDNYPLLSSDELDMILRENHLLI